MLGGGPTSQHPQARSQQIRGALPRTVTSLSLRYPQLLWVLVRFCQGKPVRAALREPQRLPDEAVTVNAPPTHLAHLPRFETADRVVVRYSSIQNHGVDYRAS
jgi:hypothetical protein